MTALKKVISSSADSQHKKFAEVTIPGQVTFFTETEYSNTSVCCFVERDITSPRTQDKVGKFTLAAGDWCARYVVGGSMTASLYL